MIGDWWVAAGDDGADGHWWAHVRLDNDRMGDIQSTPAANKHTAEQIARHKATELRQRHGATI